MAGYSAFETIREGREINKTNVQGKNMLQFPGDHSLKISFNRWGNIRVDGMPLEAVLGGKKTGYRGPFRLDRGDNFIRIRMEFPDKEGIIEFLHPASYFAVFFIEDEKSGAVYRTETWRLSAEANPSSGGKGAIVISRTDRPNAGRFGGAAVSLYGCPTAEETEGMVPGCMLTEFEGYDDVEF